MGPGVVMLMLAAFGFGAGFGYVLLGDLGAIALGTALAGGVFYLFLRDAKQI